MDLDFNWINLLVLFGALHGLVFGIVLLFNKRHPGAKFLAAFMFILSYNGFETFSWSSGLNYFLFDLFSFVWIYGLGPCLYLYVCVLLRPDQQPATRGVLMHYAPMIFQFAMRVVIFFVYIYTIQSQYQDSELLADLFTFYGWYSEPLSVLVFVFYLGLSIKLFLANKVGAGGIMKSGKQVLRSWVQALLISMSVLAIMWPATLISGSLFEVEEDAYYYPIEILLVLFIYWIAFVGYHKIKMIDPVSNKSKAINSEDAENYLSRLKGAMESDKLFLDPELNREKVAKHLDISAKVISTVLNQYANQNFNDFVNTYRINEVADKLTSGESRHLTISGIAFDAGFNSQATFQRVFKSIKGVSPKEFQNSSAEKRQS